MITYKTIDVGTIKYINKYNIICNKQYIIMIYKKYIHLQLCILYGAVLINI